ncbi:hypothetical protein L3049_03040 [Labilibaculum sp. DW002]|uniref:Uncharacterized protein n=1 Tax=Paralabilibaculum antarcticum TaxID=2912572 RepID=A0ABT5VNY2_9BACT|nr:MULTISPECIES: hypothetical protein [unclassified Labilibaculum]MBI9059919.1 hypothetical protein [Labilibaculum sp.]MDE5416970.1 hypothetical protein [Labilibaculum sp. DW002]
MNSNDIILGKGILGIQFGMIQAEVEKILGQADDVGEYSLSPEEASVTLFYHDKGLSFTFESIDQDKLSYISVLKEQYKLFQFIQVGLSKKMLMDELEHFQLGEPEFENADSEEFPTHELIFFPNENLHLWFDNNKISEIQFGPFWEDFKTIVWEEE